MKKIHDIFDATAHALAGLLFLSSLASGQFGQSQVFDGLEGLLRAKPFEGEVLAVKGGSQAERSYTSIRGRIMCGKNDLGTHQARLNLKSGYVIAIKLLL